MLKKDIVISLLAGGGGGYGIDIREPYTYFSFRLCRRRRACTCTYNIYTAMHTTHPGKEGVQTPSLFFSLSFAISLSRLYYGASVQEEGRSPGRGGDEALGDTTTNKSGCGGATYTSHMKSGTWGRRKNCRRMCTQWSFSLSHTHMGTLPCPFASPPTVLTRFGMGPERGIKTRVQNPPPSVGLRAGGRAWRRGRREALYD